MAVGASVDDLRAYGRATSSMAAELRAAAVALECSLGSFGADLSVVRELRSHASASDGLLDFVTEVADRFETAERQRLEFETVDTAAAGFYAAVVFRSGAEVTAALAVALKNIYKPRAQIGDGSTADALRFELEHEVRYRSNTGHYIKVRDSLNQLRRIERSPHLTAAQRAEVNQLIDELRHAKNAADEMARSRGTSASQLVRRFCRVQSIPDAMPSSGAGGLVALGSIVRAGIGYLVSPFVLLAPVDLIQSTPMSAEIA